MKHGQSRTETFWPASSPRWRLASSSLKAGGRSRTGKRASSGTSPNNASTRSIPIVRSISARSSGVSWVKSGTVFFGLFAGLLSVLFGGQQLVDFGGVGRTNFDDPASFVRIVVDALRLVDQVGVDFDDFARDRRVQVRGCFHRLDDSEGLARLDLVAHFGQLDIDNVAQLVLGEGGDADHVQLAVGFDPLVLGGIPTIARAFSKSSSNCQTGPPSGPPTFWRAAANGAARMAARPRRPPPACRASRRPTDGQRR